MKKIMVFLVLTIACLVQAETIQERIVSYNQLKDTNNTAYLEAINGIGSQMLTVAYSQVETANQIRIDAQAQIDADPDVDWDTGQHVLGVVDNYLTWPDILVKMQMLSAFEKIIDIMRAEMNDEYAGYGLEKRQQMAAIMSMLVLCVNNNFEPYDPNEVPAQ